RIFVTVPSIYFLQSPSHPIWGGVYVAIGAGGPISKNTIMTNVPELYLKSEAQALPPLPSAVAEAKEINHILSQRITGSLVIYPSDDMPSIQAVLAQAQNASIIHIAAHGIFNVHDPMASAIFFTSSENGQDVLRPRDFANVDLPRAAIVTL